MSDAESNEDLRRAIALSLMSPESTARKEPIDDEEDDDDDLDKPQSYHPVSSTRTRQTPLQPKFVPRGQDDTRPIAAGLLGLNRKEMENERLARSAQRRRNEITSPRKRKASTSPAPPHDRVRKQNSVNVPKPSQTKPVRGWQREGEVPEIGESQSPMPIILLSDSEPKTVDGTCHKSDHGSLSNGQAGPSGLSGVQYPNGVVKKTWALGHDRNGDEIKIEEVLQKSDLEVAVLSSFQLDADWLTSKLDAKTKVTWVLQAKDEVQVCFLIDLPRLPMQADILTPFGKELLLFLGAMGLAEAQISSMQRFDFSKTARFAFVHSIGGSHIDVATGLCSLGKGIRDLGLATDDPLNIEFLASSIGNLNKTFLSSLYLAAKGDDGLTEYEWRVQRPARKGGLDVERQSRVANEAIGHCRIYFPSRETVLLSKGGIGGAGTICFQPKFWASSAFPRALMRDCKSKRQGLLMHNKMIFVRSEKARPHGSLAWAYVGSHNLSESAWGRLVKDNTTKKPKMNIRNWECGVIIPVPAQCQGTRTGAGLEAGPDMSVFDGHLPVPMIVPGEDHQNQTPWFFSAE